MGVPPSLSGKFESFESYKHATFFPVLFASTLECSAQHLCGSGLRRVEYVASAAWYHAIPTEFDLLDGNKLFMKDGHAI